MAYRMAGMAEAIADMKAGVYDYTEDGKCSNCGQCCSNYLPVSKQEVANIKRYVKKHGVKEQIRRFPSAAPVVDLSCPFRSESEKKCLIYPVRPSICRDFVCNKPKQDIWADKKMYHDKCDVVSMRTVFYGGKTGIEYVWEAMKEVHHG